MWHTEQRSQNSNIDNLTKPGHSSHDANFVVTGAISDDKVGIMTTSGLRSQKTTYSNTE